MKPTRQARPRLRRIFSLTCLVACALCQSHSVSATEDLSGTYIMFQQTTSVTELPVLKDVTAKMRVTTLVNLTHEGKALKGAGKLCDLHIESSTDLIRTEFPAAFKRALPAIDVDLSLSGEGDSMKLNQAASTIVLGAKLKDRLREKLPHEADDSRIFDQDKDGQPGMTVKVDGFVSGEVYVVQRTTTRLKGERFGGSFRGHVLFKNEQNVVGASSVMLNRSPHPRPDLSQSFFRLEKVAPALTCSEATRLAHTFR